MDGAGQPKVRWLDMFPDELEAAIEECPVCLLPFGLAEPHGPYNALGLDHLKAEALVERSARIHGGVVAPPFAWHVQERPEFDWLGQHGVTQCFCSSIPSGLFLHIVLHQIRSLDARGFQVGILVTGHYGGLERDLRLLCEYYVRQTRSPIKLWACADWELIDYEDYRGDHAGPCETSQLMFLRPGLVDLNRSIDKSALGPMCGVAFPTADGKVPSAELGRRIVDSQVKRIGCIQRQLLDAYTACEGYRPPTLQDAEDIWGRFERLTRKYWVLSQTLEEYMNGNTVQFPGWGALGE